MKKVVAKFKCDSVTNFEDAKRATLSVVIGTKGENADFFKATPWGHIEMSIDKDVPASDLFIPGKEYYLTFEVAE